MLWTSNTQPQHLISSSCKTGQYPNMVQSKQYGIPFLNQHKLNNNITMIRRLFRLGNIVLRCPNKPFRPPGQPLDKYQQQMPPLQPPDNDPSKIDDIVPEEQTPQEQRRDAVTTLYVLAAGVMLIGLAYFYMQLQIIKSKKDSTKGKSSTTYSVGKASIGGPWKLIGTDGKPFGSDNLKGKYYLMYFGFCNCPDICPNSMTKIKKAVSAVKSQAQSSFFKLESVFVSVDPDRDSLQQVAKFARYFDKDLIGVTGVSNNDPALKDCMKKFKIYASKIDYEQDSPQGKAIKAYTIDHTIITYLMDDKGEYLTHLGSNLSDSDLAKQILSKITQHQKSKIRRTI